MTKSTSQNALYSTNAASGGVIAPPKSPHFSVSGFFYTLVSPRKSNHRKHSVFAIIPT